jgi:hypothetical protein
VGDAELGWKDADHAARGAVDRDRAPDDARIGTEPVAPQLVRENKRRRLVSAIVVRHQQPPMKRADAEGREEVAGDAEQRDLRRSVT